MSAQGLVYGLLDTSARLGHSALAAKLRGFTLSWTRYGYQGVVLEDTSVDGILARAADEGYRYCLIQEYGMVILEPWTTAFWESKDFHQALAHWIDTHDFFVAGRLMTSARGASGLDSSCLLVNLKYYEQFGRPVFELPCAVPAGVLEAACVSAADAVWLSADPHQQFGGADLTPPGWNFIQASVQNGRPVCPLPREVARRTLDLSPQTNEQAVLFGEYLDGGGNALAGVSSDDRLTADQLRFLTNIRRQTGQARRGVFLWNVETYRDVADSPPGFVGPVTSLYSVAAGFKPNMILHTHGFSRETRMVYFDYSRQALELKKALREEWDGEDFPHFVQYLFRKFPPPETFYQLWNDLSPDQLSRADVEGVWEEEIRRWGGARTFRDHWQEYRGLPHEYVLCDVMIEKETLLAQVRGEPGEVIWWSNAFFTVSSNWFHTPEQRKEIYDAWLRSLAEKNPQMYLYGFDHNNVGINGVSVRDYCRRYFPNGGDCLRPDKAYRIQIRS
jgi:hypothetical protein